MGFTERYIKATPNMSQESNVDKTPGQTAHDAYHKAHGDGPFLWEHVTDEDKQAWEAAARAVQVDFIKKMLEGVEEFKRNYYNDFSGYFNPHLENPDGTPRYMGSPMINP